MSGIFNVNPPAMFRRSAFDLSHERKLTCELGKLTPVLVQEVVPNDKWKIETTQMIRVAPLLAPLYHRLNVYFHYWFVPNRILWKGWEKFITNDPEAEALPQVQVPANAGIGSLADHMGMPLVTGSTSGLTANALPFLAYHLIWNEYYRNQHLQEPIDIHDPLFLNTAGTLPLYYRNWEKDYFTSSLPMAQQGSPTMAEVTIRDGYTTVYNENGDVAGTGNLGASATLDGQGKRPLVLNPSGEKLNLDIAGGIYVEEMRRAAVVQQWLETNMRSGYRYVENLLAQFGVKVPDYRLQRPEYIGGGKSPVTISEVLNHTSIDPAFGGQLPQGFPTGHGISVGVTNQAQYKALEHGYIIGLMSVMPDCNYAAQGIPKMYLKKLPTEFYWPKFAQLGEQEVRNEELWINPTTPLSDVGTFGYQSRYAEYKHIPSSVHGEFRSTLDYWHLARKFAEKPVLNSEFVECKPRTGDIFAVTYDKEHLWVQLYHHITAVRPMPYFNIPQI